MGAFTQALHRNRRVILLFVLMVLGPASIFTVLIVRAVRSDRVQAAYQQRQRQQQIVRLVEADLNNWLFSTDTGSAFSKSLLKFQLDHDRIVFPDFQLALPSTGSPQLAPIASAPQPSQLTAQVITEHYYPRIQAFLRDLNAGHNAGAQYFLRLGALIVRLPGRDQGYVLDVQRVLEHVNGRLAAFSAGEEFKAALWAGSGERDNTRPGPPGEALGLEGFPFFQVVFSESESTSSADVRRNAFVYSMAVLVLVTLLGSIFVYRAVSQEARLSQLKADFVSAVSHEFRSPLSSILVLSERLESARVRDPERLGEYYRLIGHEARRLSLLVTRLLDFAQVEEGKKVYSLERVELVAIAREAIQSCHHLGPPERIHLRGEEAAPLWVHADRTALRHCIQNLIENAIKYSPPASPITVACAGANGSSVVEVRDEGIGIPRAEQEKIFEKFYRGTQAADLHVQGVGIGLSLVKHVMESHRGSVSVESEPGRGSRFRLLLPRAET